VATACANPPKGAHRWTLELLADAMVKLTEHESLSGETVRRRLAENGLKPWRRDMWCIPKVDGEYVARMEDVLDLYAEAPIPTGRWSASTRAGPAHRRGAPADPGRAGPARTLRLRVFVATLRQSLCRARRQPALAQGQGHRAAHRRGLRPLHARTRRCPLSRRPCIRVVQDNLSTHSTGSLYEAFAPSKPGEFCAAWSSTTPPSTPSWSTLVEVEIGVLRGSASTAESTT